jgi:hypothetical protein
MAIQLDTIVLPDTLNLQEAYGNPLIVSAVDLTIGGTPIIHEQQILGRPLTLVGEENRGWIDFSILQSLVAIASVVNAQYTLLFEGQSFNVRFRHEDSPVIVAEPIVARPNHIATDQFNNVTINLMEL